ncbi:MAG TPA: ABC transporter substrate-binding protein [Hyphomicrobiaceae bacterium]|nr:ABC transporter substrate-binding protein [Hyphomicrobiaceae bacterium]
MRKSIGNASLAALGIAFAFAASPAQAQTPKRGGILNFAVVSSPPSYDCHAETTFGMVHPVTPHYSLLLKIDAANYPNVAGDLAESWSAAPDGLTYTFKLHKGVKFHDGSPLTSADVKASYERIIRPTAGVISARQSYYEDFGEIETPDDTTIVFRMKSPVAGVLELLASPFNCIYSAKHLKESANYPAREIMGSGAFTFVEHVQGSHWLAKRFDGYFKPGRPYLDGYKAYFVKSTAVIPGLIGGQFDAEFRFRTPPERDSLVEKLGDKVVAYQQPLLAGNIFIFNTKRKPFDDIRVRQALSLAVDRWTGGENIGKISSLRYPGGVSRPGSKMALPEEELSKLPGFWRDAEKARAEARRLLKEAGQENLSFKFLNRAGIESYTTGGVYAIDQWRRIGVKATHEQLETKLYQDNLATGNFEVGMEFVSDYLDDPTQNFVKFLSKKLTPLGYSGHEDAKIDELYEKQRRTLDPAERIKVVRALDTYVLTTAYTVPFLWSQRIVVLPKKVQGWHMTPTHYLSQDLVDVWLDQ